MIEEIYCCHTIALLMTYPLYNRSCNQDNTLVACHAHWKMQLSIPISHTICSHTLIRKTYTIQQPFISAKPHNRTVFKAKNYKDKSIYPAPCHVNNGHALTTEPLGCVVVFLSKVHILVNMTKLHTKANLISILPKNH